MRYRLGGLDLQDAQRRCGFHIDDDAGVQIHQVIRRGGV
jgi:hypothetical protein